MWSVSGSPRRNPSAHPQVVYSLSHVRLLCVSMDWGLPCSPIRGIFQARILEWVAISFSRVSSQPRDWTHVSCISRSFLFHWAIREARSPTSPHCPSLTSFTLTSLIHWNYFAFHVTWGLHFCPKTFFNIILYLKLAKKNTKNFNIALTQVSILLYLSVSGLSLSIPTDTHRDIHTLTYYLSEPFEDNLHTK